MQCLRFQADVPVRQPIMTQIPKREQKIILSLVLKSRFKEKKKLKYESKSLSNVNLSSTDKKKFIKDE